MKGNGNPVPFPNGEEGKTRFVFSIVMAVFNAAPFLREAVDSLIGQDFGFERIQLVLVDDGSTDDSPEICDDYAAKWPENVTVVHKANGGAASARNAGIGHAKGLYWAFVDADDKLSSNALSKVAGFFEKHGRETDLAAIPIVFFDGRTGGHPLNGKFSKGTRVISLEDEWWYAQLETGNCFFKRRLFDVLRFDEKLAYGENAHLVQRILLEKATLGVVSGTAYCCRERTGGPPSAAQRAANDPGWYLPSLEFNHADIFRRARERLGRIPRFLQFAVMFDLQWKLKRPDIPKGLLSPEEESGFRRLLRKLLEQIDTAVILAQKQLPFPLKLHALDLKYGGKLVPGCVDRRLVFRSEGEIVFDFSDLWGEFEFLKSEDGALTLEGTLPLFPSMGGGRILVRAGGRTFLPFDLEERTPLRSLGESVPGQYAFRVSIPARRFSKKRHLRFFLLCGGTVLPLARWTYGPFFPLTRKYGECHFTTGGLLVTREAKGFLVRKSTRGGRFRQELAFLRELWKAKEYRAVFDRVVCAVLRKTGRKPLWLISDRGLKAGDNGEAFFRYVRKEHPEIDARFVIHGKSPDYAKMKELGPVVKRMSRHHRLLALLCDCAISSQADVPVYDPFLGNNAPYRDLLSRSRFIYLHHGITKDDQSAWLKKGKKNIHGFITAAGPEYRAVLAGDCQYTEREVWLTGFPRFDRLYRNGKDARLVTVCPTWRKALMGARDPETGVFAALPELRTSGYLRFYRALLNDERLLSAARRTGFRVAFLPHPHLQPHASLFEPPPEVLLLGSDREYRDVFAESSLLLTDYSSVAFDFAYLRRPVVYVQFDKERFFDGSHAYVKGYFDYERDGFGEVECDLDSAVARLVEYMENGCRMKPEYRERVDRFFAFADQNNCRRVYEAIIAHRKA